MFLMESYFEDNVLERATRKHPHGPGIPTELAKKAVKIEFYATTFEAERPDYSLFRLYDSSGRKIASNSIPHR